MRNKLLAGLKIFGVTAVMLFGLISIIGTGGGGGGGGVAKPDTTVAAGEWHGTLTDARNTTFDIGGIISTDGQFRFFTSRR